MSARKQTLILISVALILIGAILVFVAVKSPRVYDEPKADATQSVNAETFDITQEHIYPININTATADELTMVKGIGDTKAKNIVAYREEHGPFNSVEELKEVDGIGDTLYEQIAGSFTV